MSEIYEASTLSSSRCNFVAFDVVQRFMEEAGAIPMIRCKVPNLFGTFGFILKMGIFLPIQNYLQVASNASTQMI
jgi:hypothetical protein